MDTKHLFHTPGSYLLMRMEHIALVILCASLTAIHLDEVNWSRFSAAFIVIDFVGYFPGAIAFRRSGPAIPALYHDLYNVAHSYLTWALIVGLWASLIGGFEWAMLAIPIHLSGDRGLFGNVFKPRSLPFEATAAKRDSDHPDGDPGR